MSNILTRYSSPETENVSQPQYMDPLMYVGKVVDRSKGQVSELHGFDFGDVISNRLERQERVRMLSVGCGRSALLPTLRKRFSPQVLDLVGVDCVPYDEWRTHPTVEWLQSDANQLAEPDGSFDIIEATYSVSVYFDSEVLCERNTSPVHEIVRLLSPDNGFASIYPGFPLHVSERWVRAVHANRLHNDEADIELGLLRISEHIAQIMHQNIANVSWRQDSGSGYHQRIPSTQIRK